MWRSHRARGHAKALRLGRFPRDERGIFHLPLTLALLILCGSGFGIWGSQRQWKKDVELQLGLDRCVGEAALELAGLMNSLAHSNRRIEVNRAAIEAAKGFPPVVVPLEAALLVQFGIQEAQRFRWKAKTLQWRVPGFCARSQYAKLPDLPLTRDLPDAIGPQALRWDRIPGAQLELQILAGRTPRHSAAKVEGKTGDAYFTGWKANWMRPNPQASLGAPTARKRWTDFF
jgi:hypothetical protein